MNPIVQKTLGGLSKPYYFRQFAFGLVFLVLLIALTFSSETPKATVFDPIYLLFVINTLLYPYARFVYESIVGFVMGDNVFFGSAITMMVVKFITMLVCWGFAIFIAPIGLLYLYFHHTKQEKLHQQ